MPSTRELLQELQYDAPGWNPTGPRGLLYYLNQAHRYMMSGDCEAHIRIDTATGKPPTLDTTAGTFSYTLPDDCRKLFKVAVDAYEVETNFFFYNFYGRNDAYPWSIRSFIFREHPYFEVPAQSTELLANTNASIIFVYDPSTTTDLFYTFYYVKPTEILSDSIQVQIPEKYHELLLDGVMARIGKKEYGAEDNYRYWKEKEVPRIYWKQMNTGLFSQTRFVPQREA